MFYIRFNRGLILFAFSNIQYEHYSGNAYKIDIETVPSVVYIQCCFCGMHTYLGLAMQGSLVQYNKLDCFQDVPTHCMLPNNESYGITCHFNKLSNIIGSVEGGSFVAHNYGIYTLQHFSIISEIYS